MIKIVVVPVDPVLPVRLVDHDETSLRAAQTLVGGPIEPIGLTHPAATLYVNENGKIHGLPFNSRATSLTWVHAPQLRGQDLIAGDAYLAGPVRSGLDTDTPADLIAALTGTATPQGRRGPAAVAGGRPSRGPWARSTTIRSTPTPPPCSPSTIRTPSTPVSSPPARPERPASGRGSAAAIARRQVPSGFSVHAP